MRTLTVLADGAPFAPGCRFHLSGKATLSLFPDLFLLECRNLKESDVICLQNTKDLSVLHENSTLAFGRVSDVYTQTAESGEVTTVAFSAGLDLWEARVSLSLPAGCSVSQTVRALLEASGTGIRLLSFPGADPVFARGRAFCGRAAECVASSLSAASARGFLVPAGLCVSPQEPLPPALHLTEKDLTDRPAVVDGGKKLVLNTSMTGFRPGEWLTLEVKGKTVTGRILQRLVEADTAEGLWKTQLLVERTTII